MIRHYREAGAALFLACLTLSGCSSETPSASPSTADRPNVLLITLDTTRADRLGCYGYTKAETPNLDSLAAQGCRFDLAFSTSALTAMSHASILTGLFPHQHGLRVFSGPTGNYLPADIPTLASVLRNHDYRTGAFVSAWTASSGYGLHHGFDTFDSGLDLEKLRSEEPDLKLRSKNKWRDEPMDRGQRRGDLTVHRALKWLQDETDPFFLWVHFFDPHDPTLIPPPEVTDRFGLDVQGLKRFARDRRDAHYDPEIYYMDLQVGRLLDHLRSTGQFEQTVVAVLADHGQGLGDHGWYMHRLLYQEQIRIPLLFHGPGIPAGQVLPDLVRNIDVFPTLLELVGLPVPEVAGRSLRSLWSGQEDAPRIAIAEALNSLDRHANLNLPEHQKDLLFCISDREWKLIHHQEHPENSELYHLQTDPAEQHNVLKEHPGQYQRLLGVLTELGAMKIELVEEQEDATAVDLLRSLGYVGEDE
jgi:arylsulfatase A-like enzyme